MKPDHKGEVQHSEGLVAVLLATAAVLWLAGAGAAVLFGYPFQASFAQRLIEHDPTAIWTSSAGPGFWVAYGVTLATLLLLAGVFYCLRLAQKGKKSRVLAPMRRVGIRRALNGPGLAAGLVAGLVTAVVLGAEPGAVAVGIIVAFSAGLFVAWSKQSLEENLPSDRFIVGHLGEPSRPGAVWVTSPASQNTLVVASPRGRKSSNILIPSILSLKGSIVYTSTRSEVIDSTWRWRTRQGKMYIWDPLGLMTAMPPGTIRLDWTPLSGCTDFKVAEDHAGHFVGSAGSGVTNGDYWKNTGGQIIALGLFVAARSGLPLSDVPSLVNEAGLRRMSQLANKIGDGQAEEMIRNLVSARELRTMQSSAMSGMKLLFGGFTKGTVGGETIDFDEFLAGENTLAVLAKPDVGGAIGTGPMLACLFEDIQAAVHRVSHDAHEQLGMDRLPINHFWLMDELAQIPIPSLSRSVAESAGRGHMTLACVQSKNQLIKNYGADEAGSLWDTFGVKVFGPGITDASTLNDVAVLLGAHTALQERLQGKAQAKQAQDNLLEHELRELKLGRFLMVAQSEKALVCQGNFFAEMEPFRTRFAGAKVGQQTDSATYGDDGQGGLLNVIDRVGSRLTWTVEGLATGLRGSTPTLAGEGVSVTLGRSLSSAYDHAGNAWVSGVEDVWTRLLHPGQDRLIAELGAELAVSTTVDGPKTNASVKVTPGETPEALGQPCSRSERDVYRKFGETRVFDRSVIQSGNEYAEWSGKAEREQKTGIEAGEDGSKTGQGEELAEEREEEASPQAAVELRGALMPPYVPQAAPAAPIEIAVIDPLDYPLEEGPPVPPKLDLPEQIHPITEAPLPLAPATETRSVDLDEDILTSDDTPSPVAAVTDAESSAVVTPVAPTPRVWVKPTRAIHNRYRTKKDGGCVKCGSPVQALQGWCWWEGSNLVIIHDGCVG